ncbi:MAG: Antibiotic biosynthesis monooxygenase [Actinomycetia bacterium]|nr:Antibiotic biosynthesis monooxygenase [Actinomycetes bacterium]
MIILHVSLFVPDEARAQWEAVTRSAIQRTREEPGNVEFFYAPDLVEPRLVHAVEVWESEDALEVHKAVHKYRADLNIELGVVTGSVEIYEVPNAGPSSAGR